MEVLVAKAEEARTAVAKAKERLAAVNATVEKTRTAATRVRAEADVEKKKDMVERRETELVAA
eukprot:scaffold48644_cov31-Tisochrysis_lutea.AAC.1